MSQEPARKKVAVYAELCLGNCIKYSPILVQPSSMVKFKDAIIVFAEFFIITVKCSEMFDAALITLFDFSLLINDFLLRQSLV